MKKKYFIWFIVFLSVLVFTACDLNDGIELPEVPPNTPVSGEGIIVNHSSTDLTQIPYEYITSAKNSLHIAYGHTSHGSQLTTGMSGLVAFVNNGGLGLDYPDDTFAWNGDGSNGSLHLEDYYGNFEGSGVNDLGNPNRTAWEETTRNFLNNNPDINVVIWSWCGQVSSASEENISTYLNLMNGLEEEYQKVTFVYMTGHLDGSGINGNLNIRNEQIREYCRVNNKVLFDFADIESYDPDSQVNYMELLANDACDYDSDGNGFRDTNWATSWQNSHTEGEDWYDCSSAHSQPLNANRKAYAAWWLWARIAGWDGNVN